jgi:hypothetical protein
MCLCVCARVCISQCFIEERVGNVVCAHSNFLFLQNFPTFAMLLSGLETTTTTKTTARQKLFVFDHSKIMKWNYTLTSDSVGNSSSPRSTGISLFHSTRCINIYSIHLTGFSYAQHYSRRCLSHVYIITKVDIWTGLYTGGSFIYSVLNFIIYLLN